MLTKKEKYLNEWSKNRYLFLYEKEIYNETKYDFELLDSLVENIKQLNIGDKLHMRKLKVVGKSDNYLIGYNKSKNLYSVIDVQSGLVGPTDRVFQITNFEDEADVKQLLENLELNEINLSYRNSLPLTYFN
jgi:hypothetical protein